MILMKTLGTIVGLLLLTGVVASAQSDLALCGSYRLQNLLQRATADSLSRRLIGNRDLGVALLDLSQTDCAEYAGINELEMMYAASLPKIVILWGLLKKIEMGQAVLTRDLLELAQKMIRFSSNEAATRLYHEVGPNFLIDLLLQAPAPFYDRTLGGGLWIGKEYGGGAAWQRDPLKGLSHAANAWQVLRFYLMLDRGKLLDAHHTQLMRDIMSSSGLEHKFVKGLRSVDARAQMLRKSGGWGWYQSDSVLVKTASKNYILVALVNSEYGDLVLERLIAAIHRGV